MTNSEWMKVERKLCGKPGTYTLPAIAGKSGAHQTEIIASRTGGSVEYRVEHIFIPADKRCCTERNCVDISYDLEKLRYLFE